MIWIKFTYECCRAFRSFVKGRWWQGQEEGLCTTSCCAVHVCDGGGGIIAPAKTGHVTILMGTCDFFFFLSLQNTVYVKLSNTQLCASVSVYKSFKSKRFSLCCLFVLDIRNTDTWFHRRWCTTSALCSQNMHVRTLLMASILCMSGLSGHIWEAF